MKVKTAIIIGTLMVGSIFALRLIREQEVKINDANKLIDKDESDFYYTCLSYRVKS